MEYLVYDHPRAGDLRRRSLEHDTAMERYHQGLRRLPTPDLGWLAAGSAVV